MIVRPSTYADVPRLMEIYRQARQIQLDSGNLHQWHEGFPPESLVRSDIENGWGYVIEDEGRIAGVFAFVPGADATYRSIEGGRWLDDTRPYCTIHRLGGTKCSHGVASAFFEWCFSHADNVRVDTHEDNSIMRHCIEKAGFRYCGRIRLLNGDPRIAYQKLLF